jgi:hypothetical protein
MDARYPLRERARMTFDKLIATVCAMPEFEGYDSLEQVALIKASTLWSRQGWFGRGHVCRLAQMVREQYESKEDDLT